ncbi:HemK methyltransferase member 2 [Perkinsus olseni]|uniref:HemK methyltransferase member 2 n=1 Tax=Perkinsus olseni TaxID=32597 RepID=A0A7J6RE97_PEROL|nr:HemK methyltransferase member 2 [Perkinsus olseni]
MPAASPTRKVYSPNSPELFEVGDGDPESGVTFYPPSDDTYLFLDVLHDEVEKGEAIGSGSAACILEVGPGSGVLSAYLVRALDTVGVPAHSLALDVNPRACEATEKTAKAVGVEAKIHVVLGDFNQSLHWLRYRPDIIICNPPYVPSPPEECRSTGIEASWAGGDRGREVIDRMVPVFARLLRRVEGTRQPVLYFLLEKQNRPREVCRLFEDLNCSGDYRVLGRDSDPNENGSEGPNTILRIFKASCIFMARELSAGHSVALTPSQTLVLGSDGAPSRPKPILWISEDALRSSRLKLGSGVRAEPPKGPHRGINKHAVDRIAGLGEIDLVTRFITTFFGKASEYICTAVHKGHSVNIDFNPVGRLAIDTTTGLVSFQGIEHDFANVTVQEAADPLGDRFRLVESPSRQRGIDIRSLHKEKLTIRHLVEEKARRVAKKLEDRQQPSRGLRASMSVPGLSLGSGGERKLGALVVGRSQLPRAMRSLLLTTSATVGGREQKAPPGVAEMPPLLDVFSRTPAASLTLVRFKDSLVRPSLVAEIGSYHAPPWSRLLEMDTRPGKAGLTWVRHKAEAWQAMEMELSMKERLQRRLWNTLVPPPLPEHLQESSRSLRRVGSGSRLEKTLCKWLIDGPMFRNILSRYNYYVETSSRSSGVPLDDLCPIEGEVLIRVQAKMAGQMQLWPDVDYKSRMHEMEQEVLNGYIAALRKAIVDYNLRYIFQRRRLDIPLSPSLLPPPFGANAFLVGDIMTFGGPPTDHWRRLVAHSRASLNDGKYAAPTFLCTQLTRQWSEGDYGEISLFGLGDQKEMIDIERAQLIQLQYLEGKVKYLTEEWHAKALDLVSQEPTLLAEASEDGPQADGVPSPTSAAGSPKSSAPAAFAGTGAMDGADWPTCNPDCLIEASTHLMSLMIRSVVERSCEKFIAHFEGFCPQSTKPLGYPEVAQLPLGTADEPHALLLNTLVVDGNTVKLKYSPDYCHVSMPADG